MSIHIPHSRSAPLDHSPCRVCYMLACSPDDLPAVELVPLDLFWLWRLRLLRTGISQTETRDLERKESLGCLSVRVKISAIRNLIS